VDLPGLPIPARFRTGCRGVVPSKCCLKASWALSLASFQMSLSLQEGRQSGGSQSGEAEASVYEGVLQAVL